MTNNKQSSLDYYITKLTEILGLYIQQISRDDNERIARLEEQAKEMHKEEIKQAIMFGDCRGQINAYATSEQYYNEHYGK